MLYVSRGMRLAQVAEELGLSISTVKTHTAHVYQKPGVHTCDELVDLFSSTSVS